MRRINDEKLFNLIHDYFSLYLPNHKSASEHTLRAYRNSLNSFTEYLAEKNKVSLFDICFDMITTESIYGYIDWLKDKKSSLLYCIIEN